MLTTYRLNTQELNMAFLRSIQILLPNRDVEITVSVLSSTHQTEDQELLMASRSASFDFLHDEAEDIYSLTDGVPFSDEK